MAATAAETGLPADAVQLVATTDRAAVDELLHMPDLIDVAIPRGGEGLIRRVSEEARMPVIKHFTGNCHVYIDRAAEPEMAVRLTVNSKCQRMGVCNAAESLVVHVDAAESLLPAIGKALCERGIEIRGDAPTRRLLPAAKPAAEQDYFTEYLGPVISVKVVASLDEAIEHINHYGSHHTDTIVTRDLDAARQFAARVDSSAVMVNASTRFNDGGEFGLARRSASAPTSSTPAGPAG